MKIISLIFVILCSLVACTPSSVVVFPIDKTLTPELMPLQGVTSPMRVEIKHPYLIVQNDKQNDSLFHIYNLTDKKLVGVFGRKGQGPGEFTTPWLVQTYLSDLIVEDNHKFHHYEFDSLGHPVQKESMEAQTVVSIVAEAAFINDSIFVVDERYTGPNLYKFNMNSEIPLKKFSYRTPNMIDFYADPQMGYVVANNKRIILCRGYKKEIEFMDTDFNLIKKISFEFDSPTEITGQNQGDVNVSYDNAYLGEHYLYVSCIGTSWNEYYKRNTYGSIIEVYDLDGNPVARYTLNGRQPIYFAVDEETYTLYGPGPDANPEDNLLVYQLKGLSK